jgi:hypothetical protein
MGVLVQIAFAMHFQAKNPYLARIYYYAAF